MSKEQNLYNWVGLSLSLSPQARQLKAGSEQEAEAGDLQTSLCSAGLESPL